MAEARVQGTATMLEERLPLRLLLKRKREGLIRLAVVASALPAPVLLSPITATCLLLRKLPIASPDSCHFLKSCWSSLSKRLPQQPPPGL